MSKKSQTENDIPDLDVIDLEGHPDNTSAAKPNTGNSQAADGSDDALMEDAPPEDPQNLFLRINWHIVLGVCVLVFFILLAVKVLNWGRVIDLDSIFNGTEGTYKDDYDSILPLINGTPQDDGVTTIVAFGNAPFADDRNSPDNLAAIIEDLSGAKVYNCSVANTYLAATGETFRSDIDPMDAFNFYWLTTLVALGNKAPCEQAFEFMGDKTPEDAREAYETLATLDFNTVDVITLMYDGSDYLDGREMYNDENPTDIRQFTGNMEAGIELLQQYFPNIRIIVMSPTYAFGVDENGKYVSSDIQRYGQDVLSTYVIKQFQSAYNHSVTFIDNLYGTIHEDIAKDYLTDNLHLNLKGRKLVAKRFVEALTYYDAPAEQSTAN